MNVQVIADPAGRLLWASPALPGAAHDLKAARVHGIITALTTAAVAVFADRGYVGAGGAIGTPIKGRALPEQWRAVNRAHAKTRALGEQAIAALKNWRLLHKVRCCPHRITAIIAAILALHLASRG
jgi:DDE superfamily endonuclease